MVAAADVIALALTYNDGRQDKADGQPPKAQGGSSQ